MSTDNTVRHYKGDTKKIIFKVTDVDTTESSFMEEDVDISNSTFKVYFKSFITQELVETTADILHDNYIEYGVPSELPVGMYSMRVEETKQDGTTTSYPRRPIRAATLRVITL